MKMPAIERVFRRCVAGPDECIIWTGAVDEYGYGRVSVANRIVRVHRFVYETLVGPIPDGLVIDHTCHKPAGCLGGTTCIHRRCVNHLHLEPVAQITNLHRGHKPTGLPKTPRP